MRYIRVGWTHDDPAEPIMLYSELDVESWETRKVEIYRDGTMGFADKFESAGGSFLGLLPIPTLEEIAASSEFTPEEITRDEFQRIWEAARVGVRQC